MVLTRARGVAKLGLRPGAYIVAAQPQAGQVAGRKRGAISAHSRAWAWWPAASFVIGDVDPVADAQASSWGRLRVVRLPPQRARAGFVARFLGGIDAALGWTGAPSSHGRTKGSLSSR
jgi:hypothetical protein